MATFTGTLLKREHTIGQKFVQLVFRENDKNWLCISTNPKTARLDVGQNYRIQGLFKSMGERAYIHEPIIAPLKKGWRLWQRLSFGVVIAALLVVLGGLVFARQQPPGSLSASNTSRGSSYTEANSTDRTAAQATAATGTSAPEQPAPAPAASGTTTRRTTTTRPVATSPTPTSTAPAATTPATPTETPTTPPANEETPGQGTPLGEPDTEEEASTDPPVDPPVEP